MPAWERLMTHSGTSMVLMAQTGASSWSDPTDCRQPPRAERASAWSPLRSINLSIPKAGRRNELLLSAAPAGPCGGRAYGIGQKQQQIQR